MPPTKPASPAAAVQQANTFSCEMRQLPETAQSMQQARKMVLMRRILRLYCCFSPANKFIFARVACCNAPRDKETNVARSPAVNDTATLFLTKLTRLLMTSSFAAQRQTNLRRIQELSGRGGCTLLKEGHAAWLDAIV
jgi:hypothetical protein